MRSVYFRARLGVMAAPLVAGVLHFTSVKMFVVLIFLL